MDKKTQTVQTYNKSAKELAKKFDDLGARVLDIEEGFSLVNKENPKVLEIGCGNGRDGQEILKRTNDYLGIDISEELIKLAKEKVPEGHFEVADTLSFNFPMGLDLVFAFASLIHITKEEFKEVSEKLYNCLNDNGIVRISLKYSDTYKEVTEESEFGIRTYYHYSQEDIKEIANGFKILKSEVLDKGRKTWLEVTLQKK
jgi:SAM-dependent methyltransferase